MGVKNTDGSICYIIGVTKAIRKKLNKTDGDRIHVVIEERI
jgi:phenylpyruvate tautomerase PptA (4-oxalocrotonate tautomerase family)